LCLSFYSIETDLVYRALHLEHHDAQYGVTVLGIS
jgi:hypothetical protein